MTSLVRGAALLALAAGAVSSLSGCGSVESSCSSGSTLGGKYTDAGFTCKGDDSSCRSAEKSCASARSEGKPWHVCFNKKVVSCQDCSGPKCGTHAQWCDQKACECEGKQYDKATGKCETSTAAINTQMHLRESDGHRRARSRSSESESDV